MMLEALIFTPTDKHGQANAHGGKVIAIRPAGTDWSARERGLVNSNLCVVTIPDPPAVLVAEVELRGQSVYPFARYRTLVDGSVEIEELSEVRVRAAEATPDRRVNFADMEGAATWVAQRTQ